MRIKAQTCMLGCACGAGLVVACTAQPDAPSVEPSPAAAIGGSGGSPGASSTTGGGGPIEASSSSGGPLVDCSEPTQRIYALSLDKGFFVFDPANLEFKQLGVIDCPGTIYENPYSMAVDRHGIAWVLFSDGTIHHLDVATMACTKTGYARGQEGILTFGMGFVSDAIGSDTETLFVADYDGDGLAKIDPQTLSLTFIGPYDALAGAAELTGTGDARLYGMFADLELESVTIAEIDAKNAKILSQTPLSTLAIGGGWAFAFWGGDFYLFTDPHEGSSQIDKYEPTTGIMTTIKTGVGSTIVGAGVSTCAPIAPPK